MRYIKIQNSKLEILKCEDLKTVLKDKFDNHYDSTDYIFDEDLNIRVFLKQSSSFELIRESVIIKNNTEILDIYKGTVILAKNGINKFRGLSRKNIHFIISSLKENRDHYEIIYS